MNPVIFSFGPVHIYSYGLMIAAGILCSLGLMNRRARQDGFPVPEDVADLVFAAVLAGLAGARLHYVLQNIDWYSAHPFKIFAIWEGGLIFYGGALASVLAFVFLMQIKKIPVLKGLDFFAPFGALSHAFGRVGCFLNGCCYGRPCNLPWAVTFQGLSRPVHPTQLYEAAFDFLLFLFLNRQYRKKAFPGEIFLLYLMFYAAGRFAVEFLRADNPVWLVLTWNQWISLVLFSGAAVFYFARKKRI